MDPDHDKPKPSSLPPPVLPPPNLAPPPPSPPSPRAATAPMPAAGGEKPADAPVGSIPSAGSVPPAGAGNAGPPKIKLNVPSGAADPEVVAVPGDLPPINSRLIAFVIDAVLFIGITSLAIKVLPGFASGLGWLLGIAYLLTRDSLPFLDGQSVGKKAMKLRAVSISGAPLTRNWNQGIMRNLPVVIPFFPLVELFLLVTREDTPERGRRFGDEWAKTKVVVAPDPLPPE